MVSDTLCSAIHIRESETCTAGQRVLLTIADPGPAMEQYIPSFHHFYQTLQSDAVLLLLLALQLLPLLLLLLGSGSEGDDVL